MVRQLIVPNIKAYTELLEEDLQDPNLKKAEAEKVVSAILNALGTLVDDDIPMINGHSEESASNMRTKLVDKLGDVIGGRIADSAHPRLAKAVLEGDVAGF